VGDDLCTGQRWFEGLTQVDIHPLTALAERYMDRMVCPAKHITSQARGENIIALAPKNRADGVIFALLKFCDSHAFDYPYLKGEVGLASKKPVKINSICTVFAESEVISMIAKREKREDIIAEIHDSTAARVAILARKIKIKEPILMTGGVAKNKGMLYALKKHIKTPIVVSQTPQENGAIGAAVLASQLD